MVKTGKPNVSEKDGNAIMADVIDRLKVALALAEAHLRINEIDGDTSVCPIVALEVWDIAKLLGGKA